MNTIRAGVFIGINNYDGAPLSGARPDAERMSKFFKDKYNYVDEYYDEDATEENITSYLKDVKSMFENEKKKRQKGVFVFFFSGHGVERDGRQYIVLPDGDEVDLALIEKETRIQGVDRIFILDCCRVFASGKNKTWIKIIDWTLTIGAILTGNWWYLAARGIGGYLSDQLNDCSEECGSCITIASCARGQASIDTPKGGLFTKALLSVLAREDVKSIDGFNSAFAGKFKGKDQQKPCIEIHLGTNFSLLPSWDEKSSGEERIRLGYMKEEEKKGKTRERPVSRKRSSQKKKQKKQNVEHAGCESFRMEIKSVRNAGEYVLVTGKVQGGGLSRGDVIELVHNDRKIKQKIEGIESERRGVVQSAEVGENIECWFKKPSKMHILKGDVILKCKKRL